MLYLLFHFIGLQEVFMKFLFKNSESLIGNIDDYLDTVSEGMLVFHQGVKDYLDGNDEEFIKRIGQIGQLENAADDLRRDIENRLYRHSLIPEHRGDVLGLLENMDHIINTANESLQEFDVEQPAIPAEVREQFLELSEVSIKAGESIVRASRSFFRDIHSVKDHLHKVYFYEKEADRLGDQIKRTVFAKPDLGLSHKMHLRYFTTNVEMISDRSEEVADRLSIYTIKRNI